MAEPLDMPAWIALFIGLAALAAAVGEFREPAGWRVLLRALERFITVRFVLGCLSVAVGAAVYLASPWRPGDWLAIAVSVISGLLVAQGLLLLAAGDRFVALARAISGKLGTAGEGLVAMIGFALVLAALARL